MLTALLLAAAIQRVDVHFVDDEPRAVLAILDKRAAHKQIADNDWQRLFKSEGYRRLAERERSFKRAFTDDEFKAFVMSDDLLARRQSLHKILDDWTHADLHHAAALALAYLPQSATIHARIYPSIKPQHNSFVWEVSTNPAIFLAMEEKSKDVFERTVAHELHHIGYGTGCADLPGQLAWVGGFGEGFAVLAAAGGPDGEPQFDPKLRDEWKRQMSTLDADFLDVQKFLLDVAEGRLTKEEAQARGGKYFDITGPWYTIGWTMGVTIEKAFGRERLIDVMCHQRKLLGTYNEAVEKSGAHLPRWSPELVAAIDR